jgi:uncharacterized C2H2 Zn-finger protein
MNAGDSNYPYYYCFYYPTDNTLTPSQPLISTQDLNLPSFSSENKSVKEFKCRSCNKFFKTKATADSHHKNIHEKPSKVTCAKCGQMFSNKYILKKHVSKNHPARPEIS